MSRSASFCPTSDIQHLGSPSSTELLFRVGESFEVVSCPELPQSCDLFTFYHFQKRNSLYSRFYKFVRTIIRCWTDLKVGCWLPPSSSKVVTSLLSTILKNEIVCILDSTSREMACMYFTCINLV
jgi:hypothetical protein